MNEPCPMCDRTDTTYWLWSEKAADHWGCRCGHQWAIEVEVPARVGRSA